MASHDCIDQVVVLPPLNLYAYNMWCPWLLLLNGLLSGWHRKYVAWALAAVCNVYRLTQLWSHSAVAHFYFVYKRFHVPELHILWLLRIRMRGGGLLLALASLSFLLAAQWTVNAELPGRSWIGLSGLGRLSCLFLVHTSLRNFQFREFCQLSATCFSVWESYHNDWSESFFG